MTDIVERLRNHDARTYEEAADEIKWLRAAKDAAETTTAAQLHEIERLRAHLDQANQLDMARIHEIARLRAALAEKDTDGEP